MGLRIATNVESLNAQRNLYTTNRAQSNAFARLSSGFRINQSADDAAGLAISENMKGQIRGLKQAERNANDGISLVQTAEGGLNEVSSMLIRLRELAIQSSSDTIGNTERRFLDVEYQQLKSEIERITQMTSFNGYDLLNGSGGEIEIQVGVHNDKFKDRISFNTATSDTSLLALGLVNETVSEKIAAQNSINTIDKALVSVNTIRANFGAMQNRLISTLNNLAVFTENLSAANSRIRDTDIAAESAELAKANILQQSGIAVLQNANTIKQAAIKLLG